MSAFPRSRCRRWRRALKKLAVAREEPALELINDFLRVADAEFDGRRRRWTSRLGRSLQLVMNAAVGEAVDEQRAVLAPIDARLASAVARPLERVGQGLVDEFGRMGEDVGDGGSGQLRVVEGQREIAGKLPAVEPSGDLGSRLRLWYAGCDDPLDVALAPLRPLLLTLGLEPEALGVLELLRLGLFGGGQRRAGGQRVEDGALVSDGEPGRLFKGGTMTGGASKINLSGDATALSTSERSRKLPAAETMPQPQPASHSRSLKSAKNRGMSALSATAAAVCDPPLSG